MASCTSTGYYQAQLPGCVKGFCTLVSRARLLGVNALQFVDSCVRMAAQIFRYSVLVD